MSQNNLRPSEQKATEAIRTLLAYIGENPDREELLETPARVLKSMKEFFVGYNQDLYQIVTKTFDNKYQYENVIILKDIIVESYCEHHLVPIIGKASIGYIPGKKILGLSKLARIMDIYAKRLQIQERLTVEIAEAILKISEAKGVGVYIESQHLCVTSRGVKKPGSSMQTIHLTGQMKESTTRAEFLNLIKE